MLAIPGQAEANCRAMVRFVSVWAITMLLLMSCKRSPEARSTSSAPATQATNARVFQIKGVVRALRPRQKEIEIKHEAIPGYMPAMTMPFDVKDTNELAGLAPEQSISFRMIVTDTQGWIEQ